MKLKELLAVCPLNICCLSLSIRDEKGALIDKYEIGPYVREDTIKDPGGQPRWKCIKKVINYKELNKDYWGVFTKNIPKNLLEMQVTYFDVWDGYTSNNGLCKHQNMLCNLLGTDSCIEIESETKQIKADDLIEGQMCMELEEVKP